MLQPDTKILLEEILKNIKEINEELKRIDSNINYIESMMENSEYI